MNCTDQTICTIVNFAYELDAGLFQPKFGSNMDKPKCWVKNLQLKVKGFGFCPYLTQIWLKTTQHCLERNISHLTSSAKEMEAVDLI